MKKNRRTSIDLRQEFRFPEACELFYGCLTKSINVRWEREWWYHWAAPDESRLLLIEGTQRGDEDQLPPEDPLRLAKLAERMWNDFYRPVIHQQLRTRGYVDFRVTRKGYIRVWPDGVELKLGTKHRRVAADEIISFTLREGLFTIRCEGDLPQDEPFKFQCSTVANLALFLELMDTLHTWQVDGENLCAQDKLVLCRLSSRANLFAPPLRAAGLQHSL